MPAPKEHADVFAERTWVGELLLRGAVTVQRQVGLRQGATCRALTEGRQHSVSRCPPEGPMPLVGAQAATHLTGDPGQAEIERVFDLCRSEWGELGEFARGATRMVPELSVSYTRQRCAVLVNGALAMDTRPSWRAVFRLRDTDGEVRARRSISGASPQRLLPQALLAAMTDAVDLVRAVPVVRPPAAGNQAVLLLPEAAGAFVHEVFGHLLEIDASPWSQNTRISSPEVTIVTDPLNAASWARMSVDDEGTPCRTRVLVDRGVVVGHLADRRAATRHDGYPAGDGRRSAFDRPVRTRQTHTALLSGTAGVADLAVSACLVVDGLVRGEVSPVTGRFACLFARSWHGLPGHGAAGGMVWIRGRASDAADRIVGVSREVGNGEGRCGKHGDSVPVSFSAPALLVDSLEVIGCAG